MIHQLFDKLFIKMNGSAALSGGDLLEQQMGTMALQIP
ncbi:Uncharacterised protein [Vibrio cholerae]|nr:Uncharacterised protein [Vibrio cholerae]